MAKLRTVGCFVLEKSDEEDGAAGEADRRFEFVEQKPDNNL
jgi:hypothetical protein